MSARSYPRNSRRGSVLLKVVVFGTILVTVAGLLMQRTGMNIAGQGIVQGRTRFFDAANEFRMLINHSNYCGENTFLDSSGAPVAYGGGTVAVNEVRFGTLSPPIFKVGEVRDGFTVDSLALTQIERIAARRYLVRFDVSARRANQWLGPASMKPQSFIIEIGLNASNRIISCLDRELYMETAFAERSGFAIQNVGCSADEVIRYDGTPAYASLSSPMNFVASGPTLDEKKRSHYRKIDDVPVDNAPLLAVMGDGACAPSEGPCISNPPPAVTCNFFDLAGCVFPTSGQYPGRDPANPYLIPKELICAPRKSTTNAGSSPDRPAGHYCADMDNHPFECKMRVPYGTGSLTDAVPLLPPTAQSPLTAPIGGVSPVSVLQHARICENYVHRKSGPWWLGAVVTHDHPGILVNADEWNNYFPKRKPSAPPIDHVTGGNPPELAARERRCWVDVIDHPELSSTDPDFDSADDIFVLPSSRAERSLRLGCRTGWELLGCYMTSEGWANVADNDLSSHKTLPSSGDPGGTYCTTGDITQPHIKNRFFGTHKITIGVMCGRVRKPGDEE